MSQLIAHNYLSFLTAVSREDRRLGFPPLFDNCPPKSRNKERQKKSRLFSTLYKKGKKLEKLEKILFSAFLRLVNRDKNITQESWFTFCRRQILDMSGLL